MYSIKPGVVRKLVVRIIQTEFMICKKAQEMSSIYVRVIRLQCRGRIFKI